MNLVFDIGNTDVKWATFEGRTATANGRWADADPMPAQVAAHVPEAAAVLMAASGRVPAELEGLPLLDADTPLPLRIAYRTPRTLGHDRVADACGATALFPGRDCLVVDAGTCITVDFVSADGTYHGGAIMPGVQMNLQALHTFTDKLPLVSIDGIDRSPLLGRTTEESIVAGTLGATMLALAGYVAAYRQKCPELQVVLTGGGAKLLTGGGTAGWHIEPLLTLRGLNEILLTNTEE